MKGGWIGVGMWWAVSACEIFVGVFCCILLCSNILALLTGQRIKGGRINVGPDGWMDGSVKTAVV